MIAGAYEYANSLIVDPSVQTSEQSGSNLKVDKLTERVEGAITVATEKQYFRPTLGKLPPFPTTTQDYIGLWLDSTAATTVIFAGGTNVASESNEDWGTTSGGWP